MGAPEQPVFRVDEGAPPGTGEAFLRLTTLVREDPDTAPDIFNSVGASTNEVQATADGLAHEDESLRARDASDTLRAS